MTGAWLGTPVPGEAGRWDEHAVGRSGGASRSGASSGVLHVDCDRCAVRGPACGECVISVLLGPMDEEGRPGEAVDQVDFDSDEQAALSALAGSGLVPPLRLVTSVPSRLSWEDDGAGDGAGDGEDGWGDGTPQDWA